MVFLKRTIDRTALKLGTGSVEQFLGCEQDGQITRSLPSVHWSVLR